MNTSATNHKNIVVAKTILNILPDIEQFCKTSKKVNHFNALNSFYGIDDTYETIETIIDKTFAADLLVNLKSKSMKVLDSLPQKYGKAVKLYFLESKTINGISSITGTSERSVSRHIQRGLTLFASKLETIGMNYFGFKSLIDNHRWIKLEFLRQMSFTNVKN